jgi:predicted nucleotidyltransferase
MLDKGTAINTAERYADIVKKEFSPISIVVFGSYVNGNPHEDSDIDVAVIFNGFNGDWLKASSRLWRLRRGVSYDIEPHLLDIAKDESGFVQHVLHTGQVIYQA